VAVFAANLRGPALADRLARARPGAGTGFSYRREVAVVDSPGKAVGDGDDYPNELKTAGRRRPAAGGDWWAAQGGDLEQFDSPPWSGSRAHRVGGTLIAIGNGTD